MDLSSTHEFICVLTIEPGSYTDALLGFLVAQHVDSEDEFEALSYVWGTDKRVKELFIRTAVAMKRIRITHNLDLAVRRIRHPAKPRRTWTDAVCP